MILLDCTGIGDWMGMEQGVRWGGKYVRCTVYYCLVLHFGLAVPGTILSLLV
jgi:hypothetical protein